MISNLYFRTPYIEAGVRVILKRGLRRAGLHIPRRIETETLVQFSGYQVCHERVEEEIEAWRRSAVENLFATQKQRELMWEQAANARHLLNYAMELTWRGGPD